MSSIPTKLTIAPRGYSWHGQKLQKDLYGLLCRPVCPPPAHQRPGDSPAASAEAGQGVRTRIYRKGHQSSASWSRIEIIVLKSGERRA